MKKFPFLISTILLFSLLSACANNEPAPNATSDANMVETIVAGTLSAIPTVTLTPVPSKPTGTPVQTLAPLYSEVTWENLGPSEQEILVNQQTNERITLFGNTYQAPLPSEKNDLTNRVNSYYSEGNMANMGWTFVSGSGGVDGLLIEFYNESGYLLTVRTHRGESSSITVWISDQTTIVPTIPPTSSP